MTINSPTLSSSTVTSSPNKIIENTHPAHSSLENLPTHLIQNIAEFTLKTSPELDASSINNLAASSPRLKAAMDEPYQGRTSLFAYVSEIEFAQEQDTAARNESLANALEQDLHSLQRAQNNLTINIPYFPVHYFVPPRDIEDIE